MIKLLKKYQSEIIITLIVGFVSSLINDPIRHFFRNIGSGLVISLVNHFYFCCAVSSPTRFINIIAYCVFLFIASSALSAIKFFAFPSKIKNLTINYDTRYNEILEKRELIREKMKQNADLAIIARQVEVLEDEVNNLENEINNLERRKLSKEKRDRIISKIILIAVALYFAYMIIYTYAPTVAKEDFDCTITKIRPYVEEMQVNQLNSDWVRMETRQDYLILKEKISKIEEKYGLK